ncbi:MAG TPA: PfkB family carbohydrate kinase [Nocardioidaceae bacterium]|nr:PfkB family carbohydrate kinase [Nocardioidaceae bacterium]
MTRPGNPVLVVGESLVDVVVAPDGRRAEHVGGSPMNVAVGLARLDVPTVLLTRLGDDARGTRVAEHVGASGVLLAGSSVRSGTATSTATATLDENRAATYDFDLHWDLEPADLQAVPALADLRALHVGSLGTVLPPGRDLVADLVRRATDEELFVSYDPNVRPTFLSDREQAWRDVRALASGARLVKLSDEDALLLQPQRPADETAACLLDGSATELVLLTRGDQGASAFGDGLRLDLPAPPVQLVDTVGAGDSFMAATLAALDDWDLLAPGEGRLAALTDEHVATVLSGALRAAALTCSRAGANPPRRSELPATWPAG